MNFKIITLGCKVNTYESEYIKESMQEAGFIYSLENPNIIIINTCSVTNNADSKSFKMVRRIKRENPGSIIVVCGCSAQNNQIKYQNLGIDILLGNRKKSDIVNIIKDYIKTKEAYTYFTNDRNLTFEDMKVNKFTSHTRAFVKIEDGCNNFCSYCIIPYTRGTVRSKDYNQVLEEVNNLVNNNHQEIVLTGIHTGAYYSNNHDLSDLLVDLAKIPNLKRIRISSIEITELNAKFLNVLKTTPKICDHLHIPLQSGSAKILKIMNRKYDKEFYQNKIKEIRKIRPNIAITTDAIVGHPYEDETDFLEYLAFCRELNFAKIHVFPYSKRDGTPSSKMPQVDEKIKKERTDTLLKLSTELEHNYNNRFLNQKLDVLTEEYESDYVIGHTSNYLKVYLKGDLLLNKIYNCQITTIQNDKIYGEVINCQENI